MAGRITKGLADNSYNDFNSLLNVVAEIEGKSFKMDNYGDYSTYVKICTGFVSIELTRQRKNSGFKDGVFDYITISNQIGSSKINNLQLAVYDFIQWQKTQTN